MQKAELIGAFRIGIQTGDKIEDIKQSLINAGYSIQDVEDSANAFLQGRITPPAKLLPSSAKIPLSLQISEGRELGEKKPEEKELKKMPLYFWITLIASAIIVLCLIGYIVYRLVG